MTKESFLTHIFLEESDVEMQKLATEILGKKPKGDMDSLRALVKQAEVSIWYNHGGNKTAKEVREGGGRWCDNCKSGTHNTDERWGRCSFNNAFGHRAGRCRKNPENKGAENGAIKKGGETVEKDDKITRTDKCRLKKKEEEKKKKAELEAAISCI